MNNNTMTEEELATAKRKKAMEKADREYYKYLESKPTWDDYREDPENYGYCNGEIFNIPC